MLRQKDKLTKGLSLFFAPPLLTFPIMKTGHDLIFRMTCKDTKGIVARVTGLIAQEGGNILDLEQHVEEDSGLFAMRLHVEALPSPQAFEKKLLAGNPFQDFQYWMDETARKPRVAILVTQEELCLYDLLLKQRIGELPCEIALIISNRNDLSGVAKQFSVPFHHLAIDEKAPEKQEKEIDRLLEENQIELTVLARYMRILSKNFVEKRKGRIINIHHSFLPAFKGAKPYRQAWERGVKMIGATAHYVTADLDEGQIIHQSATQVSHQYTVEELIRAGRELERSVLTHAVRAHLEHRVLLLGTRTIVFHF